MGTVATQVKKFQPDYTPSQRGDGAFEIPKEKDYKVSPATNKDGEALDNIYFVDSVVSVTKDKKTASKNWRATVYTNPQEMISKEFHGNLDELLDRINYQNIVQAKATARQMCTTILSGPQKTIFVGTRKMYRELTKLFEAGQIEQVIPTLDMFNIIKDGYLKSGAYTKEELDAVEFDEKEIVGDEKPEDETETVE